MKQHTIKRALAKKELEDYRGAIVDFARVYLFN